MTGFEAAWRIEQGEAIRLALDHFTFDEAHAWVDTLERYIGPITRHQCIEADGAYLVLTKAGAPDPMDRAFLTSATEGQTVIG